MKPRNKREKEVVSLSKKLRSLTDKMVEEAIAKVLTPVGIKNKDHKCHCMECGHVWKDTNETSTVCPNCGKHLKLEQSLRRTIDDEFYFATMVKCKDYQVIRTYYCETKRRRKHPISYFACEVSQRWVDPSGKSTIMGLRRAMSFYDGWCFSGSFEIRQDNHCHKLIPHAIVGRTSYTTALKRNGFDGQLHRANPHFIIPALLSDPKVESVWKMKQYDMAISMTAGSRGNQYFSSIKIANRHGYKITDPTNWLDLVSALHQLGKDIRNPKFICPENLKEAHDHWMAKLTQHRRRERIEEQKRGLDEWRVKYEEQKSRFFDILMVDNELCIYPLRSVDDFVVEGENMHHCVFANNYYKRAECLILRAEVKGESIATIEINLNTLNVVQCRGKRNSIPPLYDRILSLIESNKSLIAQKIAS